MQELTSQLAAESARAAAAVAAADAAAAAQAASQRELGAAQATGKSVHTLQVKNMARAFACAQFLPPRSHHLHSHPPFNTIKRSFLSHHSTKPHARTHTSNNTSTNNCPTAQAELSRARTSAEVSAAEAASLRVEGDSLRKALRAMEGRLAEYQAKDTEVGGKVGGVGGAGDFVCPPSRMLCLPVLSAALLPDSLTIT